jgi:hypothetical protein
MEGKKEKLKTLARPVPRYLQLRVAYSYSLTPARSNKKTYENAVS